MELERKTGGNFPLKLHNESRPIAYKYREGEMKRTLERELKVREIAEREANETSSLQQDCCSLSGQGCVGTVRAGAVLEGEGGGVSCC